MFTYKGKKCSGYFVLVAGLQMQGIHPMQYNGDCNIQSTDWSVDFLICPRHSKWLCFYSVTKLSPLLKHNK